MGPPLTPVAPSSIRRASPAPSGITSPSIAAYVVDGVNHQTLDDALDAIHTLSRPKQYEALLSLQQASLHSLRQTDDDLFCICDLTWDAEAWSDVVSEEQLTHDWAHARKKCKYTEKADPARCEQIRARACVAWGNTQAESLWACVRSLKAANNINRLVESGVDFPTVLAHVNAATLNRLQRPGREVPAQVAADFASVSASTRASRLSLIIINCGLSLLIQ